MAMFGWGKKSKADRLADQLKGDLIDCSAKVEEKWRYFNSSLPFKEGTPLETRMEMISAPVMEFVENHYPRLLTGPNPSQIFWMMLFTAVLQSKTYPTDVVNDAIERLMKKLSEQQA